MTDGDLYHLLNATGIHTARTQLAGPRDPPYAVYLMPYSDPIAGDYVTVGRMKHYRVELYTACKSLAVERLIDDALAGAGIVCEKSEIFLSDQNLQETIYEFDAVEAQHE